MQTSSRNPQNTYRLVLSDDGEGLPRTIEFEASSPDSALYLAQQQCRGRGAELFEGARSLGRIQCVPRAGYWVLSPSRAGHSH